MLFSRAFSSSDKPFEFKRSNDKTTLLETLFTFCPPGPLLRTNAELTDALGALDAVQAEYAERYAAFRSTFCELDDGGASARVVDRIFGA